MRRSTTELGLSASIEVKSVPHVCLFFFLECNESALFVVTYHGGHLGFYEGGLVDVSPLSWMDKALIQYIKAVMKVKRSSKDSSSSSERNNCVIAS